MCFAATFASLRKFSSTNFWKVSPLIHGCLPSKMFSTGTVISMTSGSRTVKFLSVKVQDKKSVMFKAGQWVDFKVPGVESVGGYSIVSPPSKLMMNGMLDLAVKKSDQEPTRWIHEQCHLGSEVEIRVGGDVFFDPQPTDTTTDLLLVAGGIGINPLFSIIQHIVDLFRISVSAGVEEEVYRPGKLNLLYSAKTSDELLFKKSLMATCEECEGLLKCRFFVTADSSAGDGAASSYLPCDTMASHRITVEDVGEALENLDMSKLHTFICGPNEMMESVEKFLFKFGTPKQRIHYEKW